MEIATQLQSAVAELLFQVAHICDLERLPDVIDEQDRIIIQDYVKDLSADISETFQRVLDMMTEMANYFNDLPEEEKERRPSLLEAMQVLVEMHANVMPCESYDGELKLSLANMQGWGQRLETAIAQAEMIRLYWAADVLGLPEEN